MAGATSHQRTTGKHRAVDSKGSRPQPRICVHCHRDGHLFELQTTGAANPTGILIMYQCVRLPLMSSLVTWEQAALLQDSQRLANTITRLRSFMHVCSFAKTHRLFLHHSERSILYIPGTVHNGVENSPIIRQRGAGWWHLDIADTRFLPR
jgi:hypothetical protein